MKSKAHFNPKSLTWLISLVVMIVLCVGVIFGSKALYDFANRKYNEPVDIDFTIASTTDIDISSMNADTYGVTSAKEAYDESGNLVAYIIEGTTIGYNTSVPIEMSTMCGIDILHQEETEYLGVRIEESSFKDQFTGRYLPVVISGGSEKGSGIDAIARSTVSSQAVVDGVNNAQNFVTANFAVSEDAE